MDRPRFGIAAVSPSALSLRPLAGTVGGSAASPARPSQPPQHARLHGWMGQIKRAWARRTEAKEQTQWTDMSNQIALAAQAILAASGALTPQSTPAQQQQQQQVPTSVLHQHAHDLLQVAEEAVQMWLEGANSRVAQTTTADGSTTATSSSITPSPTATVAAPSPSSKPTRFTLAPHAMHLLLRLIVLLAQRLPSYYSKAWSAAHPPPARPDEAEVDDQSRPSSPMRAKKKVIPIPKGLEVSTFQAWFARVHRLGAELVDEVLRPARRRMVWDARFGAIGLHLQVLARFHAPSVATDTTADQSASSASSSSSSSGDHFWLRLSDSILAHPWFAPQLTQYEQLRDVLQTLVSLLVVDGDAARLRRVTLLILRAFRPDPLPRPTAAAAAANGPHVSQSRVEQTPPGLVQHATLLAFVSLAVTAQREMESGQTAVQREREEEEMGGRTTTTTTEVQSESFALAILRELHEQFLAAIRSPTTTTPSSESPTTQPQPATGLHRCVLPVFGVIGLMQAIDGADKPTTLRAHDGDGGDGGGEQPPPFHQVILKATQELLVMLDFLVRTPDVQEAISEDDQTHSGASIAASHTPSASSSPSSSWPCLNSLGVCCHSCLFTLVVSAACAEAAMWIRPTPAAAAAGAATGEKSASSSSSPSLVLLSARLVARTFLHLIDVTWVLNGSIESTTEREPSSSAPSTLTTATSSLASSLAPATPSPAQPPPRLLAWLSSPFYALLPQYTRGFSRLFLALPSRADQTSLLAMVWKKVKYVHHVWRWYGLYGGGASAPSSSSGAASFAAGDLTLGGLNAAIRKARQAATEMKDVNTTTTTTTTAQVTLPHAPARTSSPATATSSSSSVRISPSPIRLHRHTLRRAHSGFYLAIVMFLGAILRDAAWRGAVLVLGRRRQEGQQQQEEEEVEEDRTTGTTRIRLSSDSRRQAFAISMIIDVLAHVEFLASSVIATKEAAASGGGADKMYQEVLAIVLALVTSREIRDAAPPSGDAPKGVTRPTTAEDPSLALTRAHHATLYRDAFARETVCTYVRCFFQPQATTTTTTTGDASTRDDPLSSPTLGLESMSLPHHLQRVSALPRFIGLPYLLAASGLPFAPTLLRHPAFHLPDPLTAPWPPLATQLTILSDADSIVRQFDPVASSRSFFLAGLFTGTLSLTPYAVQFHVLLPFFFQLATITPPTTVVLGGQQQQGTVVVGERMRSVKKRGLQGLCAVIRKGFRVATEGEGGDDAESSPSSLGGLPPAPSGIELEGFLRRLLPFLVSHTLSCFPHSVGFPQVMEVALCVFGCVSPNDLLLLAVLHQLLERAATMLAALMDGETRLRRWKQVTAGVQQPTKAKQIVTSFEKEDEDPSDSESDSDVETLHGDGETAGSGRPSPRDDEFLAHELPRNVRLPVKFPSLSGVRKLILLHLQLMQQLDGALYPRALAQLDDLLTRVLDPRLSPVATPMRSSLATMVHESLARGFDLSKRDATADWYVRLVERLNIPVAIQQRPAASSAATSPLSESSSGSSSHSSLVDAVKRAEATRPGRMATRSTPTVAPNRTSAVVAVPPAPRLVGIELNPGPSPDLDRRRGPSTFTDRAFMMMKRALASVAPTAGHTAAAGAAETAAEMGEEQPQDESKDALQMDVDSSIPLHPPSPDSASVAEAAASPPPSAGATASSAGAVVSEEKSSASSSTGHRVGSSTGSKRFKRPLPKALMKKLESTQQHVPTPVAPALSSPVRDQQQPVEATSNLVVPLAAPSSTSAASPPSLPLPPSPSLPTMIALAAADILALQLPASASHAFPSPASIRPPPSSGSAKPTNRADEPAAAASASAKKKQNPKKKKATPTKRSRPSSSASSSPAPEKPIDQDAEGAGASATSSSKKHKSTPPPPKRLRRNRSPAPPADAPDVPSEKSPILVAAAVLVKAKGKAGWPLGKPRTKQVAPTPGAAAATAASAAPPPAASKAQPSPIASGPSTSAKPSSIPARQTQFADQDIPIATLPSSGDAAASAAVPAAAISSSPDSAPAKAQRLDYRERHRLVLVELAAKGFVQVPTEDDDVDVVNIVSRAGAKSHLVKLQCVDDAKREAYYASGGPSVYTSGAQYREAEFLFYCKCQQVRVNYLYNILVHIDVRHPCEMWREMTNATPGGGGSNGVAADMTLRERREQIAKERAEAKEREKQREEAEEKRRQQAEEDVRKKRKAAAEEEAQRKKKNNNNNNKKATTTLVELAKKSAPAAPASSTHSTKGGKNSTTTAATATNSSSSSSGKKKLDSTSTRKRSRSDSHHQDAPPDSRSTKKSKKSSKKHPDHRTHDPRAPRPAAGAAGAAGVGVGGLAAEQQVVLMDASDLLNLARAPEDEVGPVDMTIDDDDEDRHDPAASASSSPPAAGTTAAEAELQRWRAAFGFSADPEQARRALEAQVRRNILQQLEPIMQDQLTDRIRDTIIQ